MAKTTKTKKNIEKPVWLRYTDKEVKEIILNIVKKQPELAAEKIGLILRDSYGIPKTKIYGFKISDVLKEAKKYVSPDLENIKKKSEKIRTHLEKNKQDKRTQRARIVTDAKLKKTREYLERKQGKEKKTK